MNHSEAGKLGAKKTHALWIERYKNNPKLCKKCNKILPYEKRKNIFCDNSCAASFNNIGICRVKKQENKVYSQRKPYTCRIRKEREKKNCIVCETPHKGTKFCSTDCAKKHHWKIYVDEMERTGFARAPVTTKKYLKEKHGDCCSVCGLTKWCDKEIVLILDHIDGNAENWALVNLRLVCPNCDSQLPTFKNRNKGKGRHSRRERYKTGQSY